MTNTPIDNYANLTYRSKFFLKRWSHQKRMKRSVDAALEHSFNRLLDFGCGDGNFLNQLKSLSPKSENGKQYALIGFEPFKAARSDIKSLYLIRSWDGIEKNVQSAGKFDVVTCFEVFEHLPPDRLEEALERISGVLSENGVLVASVPIELGLPPIIKNFYRRRILKKSQRKLFTWSRTWKSVLGKPQPDCRSGADYLTHAGFYFTEFEKVAQKYFNIQTKSNSPFPLFNHNFNSQVFYELTKKNPRR